MKGLTALLVFVAGAVRGQDTLGIYPGNWFTGMRSPALQIMLHGKDIAGWQPGAIRYPGVRLTQVTRVKNPNYLFIGLSIGVAARPGTLALILHRANAVRTIRYRLLPRGAGNGTAYARGIQSSDFVYLLMPDRFSNGDSANDRQSGLLDTACDRGNPLARHGGDLQGVTRHLDYLAALGATAVWLTPVIINDMPAEKETAGPLSGYHGYWFTDHYRIDPRLGGEAAYHTFVDSAHARGLKVIQDAVYNHIGEKHWWMNDLPTPDWINVWPAYQNTNHREETMFDPHGAPSDKHIMEAGWFVPHLPDLNLANPLLATFLIQNALWMTETFRLDGWRVDTYKYCDEHFLNNLNAALTREFPRITSFGEAWVSSVPAAAYFSRNNLEIPFKHNLNGVLDFPVSFALLDAAKNSPDAAGGLNHIYSTLAQDFLYRQPLNNCIFLDNHDMSRFVSETGENTDAFKIGIGLLMTMRGIPQLYYGTEIMMKNFKNPSDAQVREDFPGGFPGDPANKFTANGRTAAENEAVTYISRLASFRKASAALDSGALMQYVPAGRLYVYFRYTGKQTILVAVNADSASRALRWTDYPERTRGFSRFREVVGGKSGTTEEDFGLPARSIFIAELLR